MSRTGENAKLSQGKHHDRRAWASPSQGHPKRARNNFLWKLELGARNDPLSITQGLMDLVQLGPDPITAGVIPGRIGNRKGQDPSRIGPRG